MFNCNIRHIHFGLQNIKKPTQLAYLSLFSQNMFFSFTLFARELNCLVLEAHLYTCMTKFKSISIIKPYQVFANNMNYVFSFCLPLSCFDE